MFKNSFAEQLAAKHKQKCPKYSHAIVDFFSLKWHPHFTYRIRMAGIKGLQGVVRKTVNDELQANIWDPQHMDKIVPSLLFNLQSGERTERWVMHFIADVEIIFLTTLVVHLQWSCLTC